MIAGGRADDPTTPPECDAAQVRRWDVGDITVMSIIEVDGAASEPLLIGAATA
jgi:hypothetical protein